MLMIIGETNAPLEIEIQGREQVTVKLPVDFVRDEPPTYVFAECADMTVAVNAVAVHLKTCAAPCVIGLLAGDLSDIAARMGVTGATVRGWAYRGAKMPPAARILVIHLLGLAYRQGLWVDIMGKAVDNSSDL
jgi:hypothetical protein